MWTERIMRNEYDILVAGGGFAGLMAALVSARQGKGVAVLTKGAGSLTIGGGMVDLYGYTAEKKPVNNPFEAIKQLPANHPYTLAGEVRLRESIAFFLKLCEDNGYPYRSYEGLNSWLPTAIGSVKPTYLRPEGMNPDALKEADRIIVLGVKGLKDFYPDLLVRGLKNHKRFLGKRFETCLMVNPYDTGRDLSALDMARYIDRQEGLEWFVREFSRCVPRGSAVLMPAMLGTKPAAAARRRIEDELGVKCVETPVMPPSVPGLRLRQLLINELKKYKVEIIELAEVVRADTDGKRCTAIYTSAPDKERRYSAGKYIIATGGFFGGGCIAAPGKAWEAIFKIDLNAPENQEEWSNYSLFGDNPHLFASMGVAVNDKLQPVDKGGDILLENVHFAGRTVGGYDYSLEKSGNGVALVTAYIAGMP